MASAMAGDEGLDDGPLARAIRARLDQLAAEHEAAKPCTCRTCPSCKHAMHVGFIGWLYDHGYMEGDDYAVPLSESDRERLSRHVLP